MMRKNEPYGSETDAALRILMLLSVCNEPINIDRLVPYDFIATYGAYFDIDDENLHGDNEYSFGELSVRRKVAFRSIQYLVTQDLIRADDTDSGFYYSITDRGRGIADRLTSEYALRYQKLMGKIKADFKDASDGDLRDLIDLRSRNAKKYR